MSNAPLVPTNAEPLSPRLLARKLRAHPLYRSTTGPLLAAKQVVESTLRLATQRWRHLPTVVIVGAQKAGTTQLHAHLIKHPRCFSGAEKEVSYFTRHADRSVEWYRSRFPLRRRVERRRGHVIDASPSYLPVPRALRRMRDLLPDARIIAILRDPTARAFSNYQHTRSRGKEARRFEEIVAAELRQNRFPPKLGLALTDDAPKMTYYLARGYYALQLELLQSLYPRRQVLLIDSADLFADTNHTCQRVFEFLGLEPFDVPIEKIYNRGRYQEKLDPTLAERLRRHYEPHDELLRQVTGRVFSWMNPPAITRAAA